MGLSIETRLSAIVHRGAARVSDGVGENGSIKSDRSSRRPYAHNHSDKEASSQLNSMGMVEHSIRRRHSKDVDSNATLADAPSSTDSKRKPHGGDPHGNPPTGMGAATGKHFRRIELLMREFVRLPIRRELQGANDSPKHRGKLPPAPENEEPVSPKHEPGVKAGAHKEHAEPVAKKAEPENPASKAKPNHRR